MTSSRRTAAMTASLPISFHLPQPHLTKFASLQQTASFPPSNLHFSKNLAPTALSSLLTNLLTKPETRPHYPGGWGSGVGSQASHAITLAVRRRRGRSG